MSNTIKTLRDIKNKIDKLEKDFEKGVPVFEGFTIDISYGGNKNVDVSRVSIGSVATNKEMSKTFYELVLTNLKDSEKFWEDVAKKEIDELHSLLIN